jgi:hypothetical protein
MEAPISNMDAKSNSTNSDYDSGSFGRASQVGMIVPTVSEEEQQGMRTNGNHLQSLPRSVRWRIQLGLLEDPSAETTFATTDKEGNDKLICNLETVTDHNHDIIVKQAERFTGLVEKYVEEKTEVGNERPSASLSSESNGFDSANTNSNPVEIDPLTAMVIEKEAQETRKAELYLKYRKERARMKRGLTMEARVIESESDEVDRASVSFSITVLAKTLTKIHCLTKDDY